MDEKKNWVNTNTKSQDRSLGFRDAVFGTNPSVRTVVKCPATSECSEGYSYNSTIDLKILVAKLSFLDRKVYDNNDFHIKECFFMAKRIHIDGEWG